METTREQIPVALSIAGSDPSGGAGIQADLKTFTAIGVYAGAAITCLTVQNTRGVFEVHPVRPELVKKQISRVLNDLNVTHIKIGMLGSAEVAESICDILGDYTGEVIFDPVLESSSGLKLIDQAGDAVIRGKLLSLCTVITPNVPELSILSAKSCTTRDSLLVGAASLFERHERLRLIIITGGHFQPEKDVVTDFLLKRPGLDPQNDFKEASHPRIASRNTHGTGCTFSAAFTAFHLLTGDYFRSFARTVSYMDKLVRKSAASATGHGTGPLLHHLK